MILLSEGFEAGSIVSGQAVQSRRVCESRGWKVNCSVLCAACEDLKSGYKLKTSEYLEKPLPVVM